MRDLKDIRSELDQVDKDMAELFNRRMKLCEEVAEYKAKSGKAVYDRQREEEKLEAIGAYAGDELAEKGMKELLAQLMSFSRELQYRKLTEVQEKGPAKAGDAGGESGRIALYMDIRDESGALYRIMPHFVYNELKITSIEGSSDLAGDGKFRLFAEFEGHMEDKAVQNALRGLKEECECLKILGK